MRGFAEQRLAQQFQRHGDHLGLLRQRCGPGARKEAFDIGKMRRPATRLLGLLAGDGCT